MVKTNLRNNLDRAVGDYTAALLKQFGWCEDYGYWVAGDSTGVYAYGDEYFISLADMVYIVDNNVEKSEFIEWHDYCVLAADFGLAIPNLSSWVKGVPRLSNGQIKALRDKRDELNSLIESYKNNNKF